jgi:hypothetical protein
MNCGCVKHLGCFIPGEEINFGFQSPFEDETQFEFEIFNSNGTFATFFYWFAEGDNIQIPFTFNENADTLIKIKNPDGLTRDMGFHYFTTADGACTWSVSGLVPNC